MYKIFIEGIVQGVGFRPYIYRKAKQHKLVGSVRNIGSGVEIIINDREFIQKLVDLPPLAKIAHYTVKEIKSKKLFSDFLILKRLSNSVFRPLTATSSNRYSPLVHFRSIVISADDFSAVISLLRYHEFSSGI